MKAVLSWVVPVFVCAAMLSSCATTPDYTSSELHKAVVERNADKVASLLEKNGTNVDVKDSLGNPPLMHAAAGGHTEICKLLIQKGAKVNVADADGSTPLMSAAAGGHTETCKLLIQKGAKVNAADAIGLTPLMFAAMWGHTETCKLLIQKGADVNAATRSGLSALSLAMHRGHSATGEYLISKGADTTALDQARQAAQNQKSSGGERGFFGELVGQGMKLGMAGMMADMNSKLQNEPLGSNLGEQVAGGLAKTVTAKANSEIQREVDGSRQSQASGGTGRGKMGGSNKVANSAGGGNNKVYKGNFGTNGKRSGTRRISGIVAIGAPVEGAQVCAKRILKDDLEDDFDCVITDARGGFMFENLRDSLPPYNIRAEWTIRGVKISLFSIAMGKDGDITAHVTPITDMITRVSAYDSDGAIDDKDVWKSPPSKNFDKIKAGAKKMLGPEAPEEPFSGPLVADGKNRYDRFLDSTKIAFNAEKVTVADVKGNVMATTPIANIINNTVKGDAQTVTQAEARAAETAGAAQRDKIVARFGKLDITPNKATLNQLMVFTVSGTNLISGMVFNLESCSIISELPGGTDTRRRFSCTPVTAGQKSGVIIDQPGGTPLYNFHVTVANPAMPKDAVINPTPPQQGDKSDLSDSVKTSNQAGGGASKGTGGGGSSSRGGSGNSANDTALLGKWQAPSPAVDNWGEMVPNTKDFSGTTITQYNASFDCTEISNYTTSGGKISLTVTGGTCDHTDHTGSYSLSYSVSGTTLNWAGYIYTR